MGTFFNKWWQNDIFEKLSLFDREGNALLQHTYDSAFYQRAFLGAAEQLFDELSQYDAERELYSIISRSKLKLWMMSRKSIMTPDGDLEMTPWGELQEALVDCLMEAYDIDGDGRISREEFVIGMVGIDNYGPFWFHWILDGNKLRHLAQLQAEKRGGGEDAGQGGKGDCTEGDCGKGTLKDDPLKNTRLCLSGRAASS